MDTLGNVFLAACVVIVAGTAVASVVARIVVRRRIAQALQEFTPPTDLELITGLRELSRAVRLQEGRDLVRDVEREVGR